MKHGQQKLVLGSDLEVGMRLWFTWGEFLIDKITEVPPNLDEYPDGMRRLHLHACFQEDRVELHALPDTGFTIILPPPMDLSNDPSFETERSVLRRLAAFMQTLPKAAEGDHPRLTWNGKGWTLNNVMTREFDGLSHEQLASIIHSVIDEGDTDA